MNNLPPAKPITLDEVYSRNNAYILRDFKSAHQREVAKVLRAHETIFYAWWGDVLSRGEERSLDLYLATDSRILWYRVEQFDKKATVLNSYTFEYSQCTRAYLTKRTDIWLGKLPYMIKVDHTLHYGTGGLRLIDRAYSQADIERIASDLQARIDKAKSPSLETEDDSKAKIKTLFEIFQAGGITEEQYKQAMAKLIGDL